MDRVGSQGTYQVYSQILWCALCALSGCISFFLPFLYEQGTYQCPTDYQGNCREYVCSLPPTQRQSHIYLQFPTFIGKFGSFHCQKQAELNNIKSVIFFGLFVGIFLSTILLKFMRKKIIIIAGLFIIIIGFSLMVFSETMMFSVFGSFLIEAFTAIPLEIPLCFITEVVSPRIRAQYIIYAFTSYSFGIAINGFLFYIMTWEMVIAICFSLQLLGLLVVILYIEETPFDLFNNPSAEQTYNALIKIADRNGITDHGLTLQQIASLRQEYYINKNAKNHGMELSFLDLFSFSSLRKITLVSLVLHFCMYYIYGAPELVLNKYSLSIYVNGMMLGISEVIGSIICIFFIDDFPRKTILYGSTILQIVILTGVLSVASCFDQCSTLQSWIQTVGLFFFRLFAGVAYNGLYVISEELFPTQIRTQALILCSSSAGLAQLFNPIMVNFTDSIDISIIWTFLAGSLIILFLTFPLPQTYNLPIPNMIEQLNYAHHNQPEDRKVKPQ